MDDLGSVLRQRFNHICSVQRDRVLGEFKVSKIDRLVCGLDENSWMTDRDIGDAVGSQTKVVDQNIGVGVCL
jgi:hypothetical protein